MKRVLLVLAACSDSSEPPEEMCPTVHLSDVTVSEGRISSGQHLAGVTWLERRGPMELDVHGAIVSPDGSITADIHVASLDARATPGKTTVLWWNGPPLPPSNPHFVTLQRGAETQHIELSVIHDLRIVFDGASYQIFWTELEALGHRSLSEDGVLGPVHMIAVEGVATFSAATDGAGTTYLQIFEDAYSFDSATGAAQRIYDAATGDPFAPEAFYFAGEFHLRDDSTAVPRLISITPTGATRARTLIGPLAEADEFYAVGTKLFAKTALAIHELDPDLTIVKDHYVPPRAGVIGDRVLDYERAIVDPLAFEPGRIFLKTEAWRRELAVDSPVRLAEVCGPF